MSTDPKPRISGSWTEPKTTNVGVWNGFETWVTKHGGISALAGLIVAYGPLVAGYDWSQVGLSTHSTGVIAIVVSAIVSIIKLYFGDNSKVPEPETKKVPSIPQEK